MGNGRGKLDIPYMAIAAIVLVVVVAASLALIPEWRQSPTGIIVLIASATVAVIGLASNFRSAFIRDKDDTPPAALDRNSDQHRRNQENVCANVRDAWIDGVLRDALPERVRLELALDTPRDALLPAIVQVGTDRPLKSANDIVDIYRAGGRSLLILGAPGSGKTVTLLELCRPILEGAEADRRRPVPVVLNLSTWAQKRAPLAEWIVDEMWRQYGLSRKVASSWLAADHLTLLLDGLDEVAPDARDACVQAINNFRETHNNSAGIVVCSRSADYAELHERLALGRAVEIRSLTPEQVDAYLSDERLGLEGVRQAIARDDALRELSTTPLILNVMAMAYGGRSLAELQPLLDDAGERRAHLYDAYIARMFARRPLTGASYTVGQALRRLRFIAAQLTERDETLFYMEDLQPDWLPGGRGRWVAILFVVLFVVLGGVLGGVLGRVLFVVLGGVLGGVLFGVLGRVLFGVLFGVLVGVLGGGLVGVLGGGRIGAGDIITVEELELDLSLETIKPAIIVEMKRYRLYSVSSGAMVGVMFGILVGVRSGVLYGVLAGVLAGIGYGVISIVLSGVLDGVRTSVLKARESKHRNRPNEGIHRSTNNALRAGVLFGVLFGGLGGVLAGGMGGVLASVLFGGLFGGLGSVLGGVLVGGLVGVLAGGMDYGGTAVIRHYILRLLLALHHLLPWRLESFMEAMRERILVQRAGGAYRFIHRSFQEHIADLTDERIAALAPPR